MPKDRVSNIVKRIRANSFAVRCKKITSFFLIVIIISIFNFFINTFDHIRFLSFNFILCSKNLNATNIVFFNIVYFIIIFILKFIFLVYISNLSIKQRIITVYGSNSIFIYLNIYYLEIHNSLIKFILIYF